MKNFVTQSIISGGIKAASAGLTFLMFLFLARALGPEEYGRFGTMFSLGSFLACVISLGQPTRLLKRLPGWLEAQEFGLVATLLQQSLFAVLVAGLGTSAILYLASLFLPWPDIAIVCLGSIPFVLPFALADVFASLLRVLGSISQALLPRDIIWRATIVLFTSGLSVNLFADTTAQSAMLMISLLLLSLVVGQTILFWKRLSTEIGVSTREPLLESFWATSTWFWLASLVGMMANHLAVVFTAFSLSDTETGAFFAASKITQLIQLPLMAANIVAAPVISRLFAAKDFTGIQNTCRTIAPFLILVSVLSAAVMFMAPAWLLSLFDSAYTIAAPALVFLALGQLINVVCGPTGILLLMTNGERHFLILTGISEGLGLVLILVLAPNFGLVGAASAALVGKLGWNILAVIWCKRQLNIDPSLLSIFQKSD